MTLQTGAAMLGGPRRWDVLSAYMLELGYKTFVEVGCKEGRTTGHILATVPDSRVIAIDPWMAQEATHDPTKETYQNWDFAKIEAEFWANVGDAKGRCRMLRVTSAEAAESFALREHTEHMKGLQADLIFIDALHDYEHVKQDIALWWPMVRVGGMLAGHDFNHKWPGVERAVAEAFNLIQVAVGPDSVWCIPKMSDEPCRL